MTAERALLVTEFYKSDRAQQVSVPVRRAQAFEYILKNKHICINPMELIVGERGPAPRAVPTYPEVSLHTLEDLDILDARPKVSYKVDQETRDAYRDVIIPFWKGKSNREKIMANMDRAWLDAYEAGMFTEFQEQRAPGHTVAGNKIYGKGMHDIQWDIKVAMEKLNFFDDPEALNRREQLKAMHIVAEAIIMYAGRHAEKLEQLAENENDENRKIELLQIAEICRRVPANKPETFHEA
ncbi:MAG: pyruvate formate lyase family protein, partial [Bacteroidota bacterium]